jgi:hypothetical protein
MIKRLIMFMAIFLCFGGYVYASDVTYDILDYYPLTPGYAWVNQDGKYTKITDYGQIDGHHVVNRSSWSNYDRLIYRNLIYFDADYLYFPYYYNQDGMWKFDPITKLKRKITVGETIGNDYDLVQGDIIIHRTYSRTLLLVEDVTTPAGEFHNCLKFLKLLNGESTYDWWAPNVGIVKTMVGERQDELVSYNFAGHNASPTSALSTVEFPAGVTPSNNQVQIGACDNVFIQPTLSVPSVDVGKAATLIMYIYLPDLGFGANIPSKTEILTAEMKWTPSQGQFSPKLRCASFCRLTE